MTCTSRQSSFAKHSIVSNRVRSLRWQRFGFLSSSCGLSKWQPAPIKPSTNMRSKVSACVWIARWDLGKVVLKVNCLWQWNRESRPEDRAQAVLTKNQDGEDLILWVWERRYQIEREQTKFVLVLIRVVEEKQQRVSINSMKKTNWILFRQLRGYYSSLGKCIDS